MPEEIKETNEKKEIELVVDKKTEDKPKSKINPEVIEKLQKAIDEKITELDNKKYLIPGGDEIAKLIKQFIVKDAKWRFTECLGIIEINRAMHEFISDTTKKELMVTPLTLEALYYFMSKHEGEGLPSAEKFTSMLKSINQAKHRADEDKKEFEQMKFRMQSLQHGVDPDNPAESLKDEHNG